jgi:hypothetical protein
MRGESEGSPLSIYPNWGAGAQQRESDAQQTWHSVKPPFLYPPGAIPAPGENPSLFRNIFKVPNNERGDTKAQAR